MISEEAQNRLESLELAVGILLQEVALLKEKLKDVPRTTN